MALSNWDTLAFDMEGRPTNGSIRSEKTGVGISIYKNWLYIYDEKVWDKNSEYISPCVGEVWQGEVRYKDITVLAKRGPKVGIYTIVIVDRYDIKDIMFGIGCYGYIDDGKGDYEFVGVEDNEVSYLFDFIESEKYDKYVSEVKKGELLRFNQGDMYFAGELGTNVPTTPTGETLKPIIETIIGGSK